MAERTRQAIETLPPRFENRLLDLAERRLRGPSFIGKAAVWFILLWFPLVQAVAEGTLQALQDPGSVDLLLGLYKVVAALSAVKLLPASVSSQ